MLHAASTDRKPHPGSEVFSASPQGKQNSRCAWSSDKRAVGARTTGARSPAIQCEWPGGYAQAIYGNQAILRAQQHAQQNHSALSFTTHPSGQELQRKQDCACGGQCAECGGNASQKPMGFNGDLEKVFSLTPEGNQPANQEEGGPDGGGAQPAQTATPAPAQSPCSVLCDQAYANPALNTGGGGLVCMNGLVCACVFDNPPLRRGMCPGFDAIVMNHERRHLGEAEPCPANATIRRLGPAPGVDLLAIECLHRRESIAEIDAILPGSAGICRTGMEEIRRQLATWVAANCGGP